MNKYVCVCPFTWLYVYNNIKKSSLSLVIMYFLRKKSEKGGGGGGELFGVFLKNLFKWASVSVDNHDLQWCPRYQPHRNRKWSDLDGRRRVYGIRDQYWTVYLQRVGGKQL